MFKNIALLLKKSPPLLGFAANSCPFIVQQKMASHILNRVFAEALRDGDMDFLAGRTVGLTITDMNLHLTLTLQDKILQLQTRNHQPEALICGNLSAFVQLAARQQDPDSLFFQRKLSMQGDTELGLEVKNLIDSIDVESLPTWMHHSINTAAQVDTFVNQYLRVNEPKNAQTA